MDIQVSSNFERLVHFISKDSKYTRELFEKLEKKDNFEISKKYLNLILKDFEGGCLTDRETEETLKNFHTEFQLIIDPHTAVGYAVGKKMLKDSDKRVYLVQLIMQNLLIQSVNQLTKIFLFLSLYLKF